MAFKLVLCAASLHVWLSIGDLGFLTVWWLGLRGKYLKRDRKWQMLVF